MVIIQNVDLSVNGIASQLVENEVIDVKCVEAINRKRLDDKEGRGAVLMTYLLNKNDVDRYEGFLVVWDTDMDETDKLRPKIHNALKNLGLKVPERWANA
jgi:FPC/CPF motif-containing protein YcgG